MAPTLNWIQLVRAQVDRLAEAGVPVRPFAVLSPDGIVLSVIGSPEERLPNWAEGADWGAGAAGHTAVAEALAAGRPALVGPAADTRADLQAFTTAAAPVRTPDGAVVGCLLTLSRGRPDHLLLQAVAALALAVQADLNLQDAAEQALLHSRAQKEIVETISEGFMAMDRRGVVTYLNRVGGEILGLDPDQTIGRHILDVVDFRPEILNVLETGKGWVDREFFIDMPRGRIHLLKSAIPVFDAAGQVSGVIDTFREIKHVRNLVTRMVGAQAVFSFSDIVGESALLREAVEHARAASRTVSTVLIQGESGTGKELFAQAIHRASARAAGPFVTIDCTAMPRELVESELFGYAEGAFTGAIKGGRPGKFELAHGGTIFLDEIGEMPLDLQAKLLRVLQTHTITRVGGHEPIPVDIRIIAATNRRLPDEVRARNFRADLFYRLNVVTVLIPALRDRPEDIPLLARHFLHKIGRRLNKPRLRLDARALRLITAYSWPGNVRELENAIERAINLAPGEEILPEHLPAAVRAVGDPYSGPVRVGGGAYPAVPIGAPDASFQLRVHEREAVARALAAAGGNRSRAARMLGISRSTLYEKMSRFGLDAPRRSPFQ